MKRICFIKKIKMNLFIHAISSIRHSERHFPKIERNSMKELFNEA